MTKLGLMTTPPHHDRLHRALQNISLEGEDAQSSCSIDKEKSASFSRRDEPFDVHSDTSRRRSSQLSHPQQRQHLRQRRPESCGGAHDSLERPALTSAQSYHGPHAVSEECWPNHPNPLLTARFPEAGVEHDKSFVREPGSSHPKSSKFHGPDRKESDELHGSQSPSPLNSYPLDYRAAVLRERPVKHHQLESDDNYFDCYEDDKQKNCFGIAGTIDFQQRNPAFGENIEEKQHAATDNQFYEEAEHAEQIERQSMLPKFSQSQNDNDQIETNAEFGHMVSERCSQGECQSRQLHRELSKSSSDDSFCNISKEAVEWEYKNEHHLLAPSQNQAKNERQIYPTLVYDYSSVGVTLIDDKCTEQQNNNLCNTKELPIDLEEGSDNEVDTIVHDDQSVYDSQYQDIESPPLFLGFNHDNSRFVCCTSKGFRVYDIESMKELFSCLIGGVSVVDLVVNSDSVLLVGGGPNPIFPVENVVLWDAINRRFIAQVSRKFPILAVKARFDRLVVVLESEVCVYNCRTAKLLFRLQTISNIKGLCALSLEDRPLVLACPGIKKGQVRIEHIITDVRQGEMLTRKSLNVSAHDSGLACVALNSSGSLLATASDRGTLVRIFRAENGTLLQEVRRGSDRAEIYSLAFSVSSDWLALSSDKGTVHVFGVRITTGMSTYGGACLVHNPGSTLSFIKGVLPKYFKSEWSHAQFKLPQEMKSVISFGQEKGRILVLCTDGSFYKLLFDSEHGGDMKQLEFLKFL